MHAIIVAFDSRLGIGRGGGIPWKIPYDLKSFEVLTRGLGRNAVVMGRKTWESIGSRALPNRSNIVLTRTVEALDGADVEMDFDMMMESIDDWHQYPAAPLHDVFFIGGAEVYAKAIQHQSTDKIYYTEIDGDFGCDAFFPCHPSNIEPTRKHFLLDGKLVERVAQWEITTGKYIEAGGVRFRMCVADKVYYTVQENGSLRKDGAEGWLVGF
jgi:dihydrofolate reductase